MIVQQRAALGSLRAVSCEREIELDDRASDRLQLCDCRLVKSPWLVQIKRLNTSDNSDATSPTTDPTMLRDSTT
jgi:hypothetical protein